MGKKYNFDYIIIGSGIAGSTAALQLAKTKKKVALIEKRFFGGANLNTYDLPCSVALDFSHNYSRIQSFPELKNQDFNFNLPTIPARTLKIIVESGGNNSKIYEDAGITCIKGAANFIDQHTVAVNEKLYTANNFILATGASLKIQEIAGTDHIKYLSPESAIKISHRPKVAAIVGAGPTGCEIAEYYAELGIKTILLETADRILPREDAEVGDVISDYFARRLGITVLTNSKVVAIEEDDFSKRVIFQQMNSEKLVRVDCIVLVTGSRPNLDFGLENAKVKYNNTGIIANKYFETSSKNIYAVGDALGGESSTDKAYMESFTLANNIVNKVKNPTNYRGLIRVIKTLPEVAVVGYTEDDLLKRDRKYHKSIIKLNEISASRIHSFDYGFIKLLADRTNHILGACIVAPHAELIASEIALAIRHNLTVIELASNPHSINSYNYLVKLAAKSLLTKKLK